MTISPSEAWIRAAQQRSQPYWLVEMDLGPTAFITVLSYSTMNVPGTTIVFQYSIGGVPGTFTLTAGFDFSPGVSNDVTAQRIADAFNAHAQTYALVRGSRVTIIPAQLDTDYLRISSFGGPAGTMSASPDPLRPTYYFCTGKTPLTLTVAASHPAGGFEEAIPSLGAVEPASHDLDPITRKVSIGAAGLSFADDGEIRSLFARTFPKGKVVRMRLGFYEAPVADAVLIQTMVIRDWDASPGAITVDLEDPYSYILDQQIFGSWVQMHPAAVVRSCLAAIGFPAEFYNDATLETTTHAQFADISHWSLFRNVYPRTAAGQLLAGFDVGVFDNQINSPTGALGIIDDVLRLLHASFAPDESAIYQLERYDPDGAVSADLVEGQDFDVVPGSGSTAEDQVTVAYGTGIAQTDGAQGQQPLSLHAIADEAAQRSTCMFGVIRDLSATIDTDWLGAPALNAVNSTFASADVPPFDVNIANASMAGFCGFRQSSGANTMIPAQTQPSQRATDELDATRPLYLLWIREGYGREIMRVDAPVVWNTNEGGVTSSYDRIAVDGSTRFEPGYSTPDGYAYFWTYTTLTIAARSLFGTGALDVPAFSWAGVRIYDITILVDLLQRYLDRARWGIPKKQVKLRPWFVHLPVGAKVTITTDQYLNFGKETGADTGVVWEIINKAPAIVSDEPSIVATLAWVRDDVVPVSIPTDTPAAPDDVTPPTSDFITLSTLEVVTDVASVPLTRG